MSNHMKVILGSLIFALMIVGINGLINYFFVSQSFSILNVRSFILFSVVFLGSVMAIGESTEQA